SSNPFCWKNRIRCGAVPVQRYAAFCPKEVIIALTEQNVCTDFDESHQFKLVSSQTRTIRKKNLGGEQETTLSEKFDLNFE
ncbi:unnamed protein product, partial [Ceratitis capitata]